ncbi:MAG TPA: cysteine hydrolase family protein, partial [Burkholderiaceae bacterium]
MQMDANPFPYVFDTAHTALVLIDMQRDFIEPGGFGAALGNDVRLLEAIVPATQAVLAAWRRVGGAVVHTREAHKPDLSDCPPAKRNRGNPSLRIGDVGPMGRILVAGEPG